MSKADIRLGAERMLAVAKRIQKDGLEIESVVTADFMAEMIATIPPSGEYHCPNIFTTGGGVSFCRLAQITEQTYTEANERGAQLVGRMVELTELVRHKEEEIASMHQEILRHKNSLAALRQFILTLDN